MKVLAYYPLHYGAEYLNASIKAIENHVDKIIILYSEAPSFGYFTNIRCPESELQLRTIAEQASPKVEWVKVSGYAEGEHRNIAFNYAEGYDLLLAVDADEVWDEKALIECLDFAYNAKEWRVNILGFINFWHSFNHACYDSFAPGRIYNLNNKNKLEVAVRGRVYHFGYAQSDAIINYKMAIHGHKNDIFKDWLQKTYFGWKEGNLYLHPASSDAWQSALPFDKETLPELLKQHPNYNKEKIC